MKPLLALALWVLSSAVALAEYEIGGPLAGLKLPLFPTQHGEPPGYPGSLPDKEEFTPEGQAPERLLYDGSVEHWRSYMFKYMPIRSFFDRQSQLKNWTAPSIPGAESARVERYAAPVYWVPRHRDPVDTGRRLQPAPVVRMKTDGPTLTLDLGELPIGMYALRVIGAVKTEHLRPFRKPLFLRMTVNDDPDGGVTAYRNRLGYCDEFYSVAEFYFHASVKRTYRATLRVDRGSMVDLLVHNVSLDDVLAGTIRKAIKARTTTRSAVPKPPPRSPEDDLRRARDAAIWKAFPPLNAQASGINSDYGYGRTYGRINGVAAGNHELTGPEIVKRYGRWAPLGRNHKVALPDGVAAEDVFLANAKLGLFYTLDDLRRNRPLPDPYPVKDDGAGLYFPDPKNPAQGRVWTPIGARVGALYRDYYMGVGNGLKQFERLGDVNHLHDAAITLARWAYAFPAIDYSEFLSNTVHQEGPFGRDYSCRRRETTANFLPHYPMYVEPILYEYDALFDFISGNQTLADSIGRFVPWVKEPQHVIQLIDVYLVQTTAKRILRYHYHTGPMDIAKLAAVVGNSEVTDPWMEWLWARTFVYPLPPAGAPDVMISGTTREGTEFVGSAYYSQGEGAARIARSLDSYQDTGGNPRFNLSDVERFPKPVAHCFWRLENMVAGWDFLRIGDVCGPDKAPGHTFPGKDDMQSGWRWTRDPRFAFVLRHYHGDQRSEIAQAAAQLARAPWLDNRSRVMPMWAGILETGHEFDDPRFRRAAYLRLGYGVGHHHNDSVDLQVVAHGLPMTIDGGQRPGYSTPADRSSRVHNLVEVDGRSAYNHSWATTLADADGARYLAVEALPPGSARRARRQIALVDVDAGQGAGPLPVAQQRPGAKLPGGVTTPNSYVFDVYRVSGGQQHTYCFHGALDDDFQWNVPNAAAPAEGSAAAEYLGVFKRKPQLNRAGDAPSSFQATWRMAIEVDGPGRGEKEMAGSNYQAGAPRKFTRLHLLGTNGQRAMHAKMVCQQWGYEFTNVMVQRRAVEGVLESAFAAVIEPYAGSPFIQGRRLLDVADNEADALRAVAVEVKTKSGRTDVCFADGRPETTRLLPSAELRVAGEFAYYSSDENGLRQATLAGGTLLEAPGVRLEVRQRERTGRVVAVDYGKRRLTLEAAWPSVGRPGVFEIGVPDHMTTYTAVAIDRTAPRTVITVQRGADYYRSGIVSVDAEEGTVTCTLTPLMEYVRGNRRHWVASDDRASVFWRADYTGSNTFKLTGRPVTREAFGREGLLRLWEYGVGDGVRQSTWVSLRRLGPKLYELEGDIEVTTALTGTSMEISSDRREWRPVRTDVNHDRVSTRITAEQLGSAGKIYLRVQ